MLAYLGRQVPEGSEGPGVCWCRFRIQVRQSSERLVPEGLGRFRRVPVCVLV